MIVLIVFCMIKTLQIHSLVYLNLKPLKQYCIKINKTECTSIESGFHFVYDQQYLYTFKFKISKENISHVNEEGYSTLKNINKRVSFFVHPFDVNGLYQFDLFFLNMNEKFQIHTYSENSIMLIRIKVFDKTNWNIDFIFLRIHYTSTSYDVPAKKFFGFNFIYRHLIYQRVIQPYNTYIWKGFDIFLCSEQNIGACKGAFLLNLPFKNENSENIQAHDSILNQNKLEGVISHSGFQLNVEYTSQNSSYEDNRDYDVAQESIFGYPTKNVDYCEHIDENGFLNVKCKCSFGYFGVDCTHKYNYLKIDYTKYNICGLYGILRNNFYTFECICNDSYSGKYCTKSLKLYYDKEIKTTNVTISIKTSSDKVTKTTNLTRDYGIDEKIEDLKRLIIKTALIATITSIAFILIINGGLLLICKKLVIKYINK